MRGVVNLAGLIFGIFLAGMWYETVGGWLGFISNPDIANTVGFIAIMVLVMIAAGIVGGLLHKIISGIMLGWLDHLVGGHPGAAHRRDCVGARCWRCGSSFSARMRWAVPLWPIFCWISSRWCWRFYLAASTASRISSHKGYCLNEGGRVLNSPPFFLL